MSLLSNYVEMLCFIEEEIKQLRIITSSKRVKVAATLLTITIDHAQGIKVLLEKNAYPSAGALMRVLFETYIRAMWVWKCADDKQVETFLKKDKIKSKNGKQIDFKSLVKDVEKGHGFPEYFSEIQKNTWNGLNSLTHGGIAVPV